MNRILKRHKFKVIRNKSGNSELNLLDEGIELTQDQYHQMGMIEETEPIVIDEKLNMKDVIEKEAKLTREMNDKKERVKLQIFKPGSEGVIDLYYLIS